MLWDGGFIRISAFRLKAQWDKEYLFWVSPSWGPEPSAPCSAEAHPP